MRSGGVIFDLDGTLIASESTYLRAWHDAARETGEEMTDELYIQLMGFNRAGTIERLGAAWSSLGRATRFVDASQRHYERLVAEEGHRVRPGIRELLDHATARGLPLAVATSTHRSLAEQTLADIGLARYFRVLVGGDEVARGKPDPEIYLTAAARLGVAPATCVAFEDTSTGANAALAAAMIVVLIPELHGDSLPVVAPVRRFADHRAAIRLFSETR